MLDVSSLRRDPEAARRGLAAKGETADLDWFLQQDKDFRAVVHELDGVRARQNQLTQSIGKLRQGGGDAEAELAQVAELKEKSKHLTERHALLKQDLRKILMRLPNLPADDVPVGAASAANVIEATWGDVQEPEFAHRPHWELGEELGLFHTEQSARIAGSGFTLLTGDFAQLERALSSYMLDIHTREHGYTEVSPPSLVRSHCLEGTGQLPKFEGDMYRCEGEDLFLIPTAEVPLTNVHRQQILAPGALPLRYVALTPCYRRESGAAGRETRGLIRVHQFQKVELMSYVLPEESDAELLRIREHAETILRNLHLPFRTVLLGTGDLSFAARKTYDLEVWAAGVGRWLEVSSISAFGDFQARRATIRFRRADGAKPEYAHTLNGSGLALPRVLAAVLENNQRADGSIEIPEVLRPYMGWRSEIRRA